ncbi:hypothetical protein E4U43_001475 [Claviceps pusilla]|uniref:Uncharacterized protein n=1 Tax=Claviceps pusilla TaxID=123648 RepID=A0A9P7NA25_9HYPO|nr:hypothetical protein E4U43_001475 [Claviceps pusilla]
MQYSALFLAVAAVASAASINLDKRFNFGKMCHKAKDVSKDCQRLNVVTFCCGDGPAYNREIQVIMPTQNSHDVRLCDDDGAGTLYCGTY